MSEVVTAPNSPLVSFIERAARDQDFDVQKFGELLRMQREVEHDQARKAFNRDMAAVQSEMMPVIRTAENTHLKNKYAKLEDIDREMRPIYTRHGFSVRFGSAPAPRDGDLRITCTVAHDAGYFEENYLDCPAAGKLAAVTAVQAIGSSVTYLRRYLLTMVFNVVLADDDDDGEGMRGTAAGAAVQRPPRKSEPVTATSNGKQRPSGKSWVDDACDRLWVVHQNGTAWAKLLLTLLSEAPTEKDVLQLGDVKSIQDATAAAPPAVKRELTAGFADAIERFRGAAGEPEPIDNATPEQLAEVEIEGERFAAGD